jgi:hypothetical protein
MSWDEAQAAFLQSRQLGINGAVRAVKPRTLAEYKLDLAVFFDFLQGLGLTHYNQLTEKTIQDFVAWLQSPDRGKGGWGKATPTPLSHQPEGVFSVGRIGPWLQASADEAFPQKSSEDRQSDPTRVHS